MYLAHKELQHSYISCSNLYGHGKLHSGLHILLTFHIQLLHGVLVLELCIELSKEVTCKLGSVV